MSLGVTRLAERVFWQARPAQALNGRGWERVITGFVPYLLGVSANPIAALDPDLTLGPWPAWSVTAAAFRYGKMLDAPIGRSRHIARLGLQVWHERVAAVVLDWPRTSFASPAEWRKASWALRDQVMGTYAPEIARSSHRLDDDALVLAEADDGVGSRVVASAADRTISLVYLWGPFARAVPSAPALSRTAEAELAAAK